MFIDEKKTAELMGVDVRALRNWRVRGGGPPFYKVARLVRYDQDEVITWVKARRFTSTTQADQGQSTQSPAASTQPYRTVHGGAADQDYFRGEMKPPS